MTLSSLADFGLTSVIYPDNIGTVTADSANRVSAIADTLGLIANYTQGTDANKPILTRADNQENLVQYSEDFGNTTYWSAENTSRTSNQALDSNGNMTLANLVCSASNARHSIYSQSVGNVNYIAGLNYTMSVQVRYNNHRYVQLAMTNGPFTLNDYVNFDILAGTVGTVGSSITAYSITELESGLFNLSISANCGTTGSSNSVFFIIIDSASAARGGTFNAAGTEAVYIGRGVMRTSLSDTTYVATTDAKQYRGVNGRRALRFNGANEVNSTSISSNIFTSTDKLVYAVVRPNLTSSNQLFFECVGQWWYCGILNTAVFSFNNWDTAYDTANSSAITVNTPYIVRFRQTGGNIFTAIDIGAGFVESAPVASGATSNMTTALKIGRLVSSLFYGDIAFIGTANTGATKPNLEKLLREEFMPSSKFKYDILNSTFDIGVY